MERPSKPSTQLPDPSIVSDFDVESYLEKLKEVLRREVHNLMAESSRAKLSASSARDLVNYLKLLSELKNSESASLAHLDDEQLKKLVRE